MKMSGCRLADPGLYVSNGDAEMHLGATGWSPLVYPCILWLCYSDIDRWIPYKRSISRMMLPVTIRDGKHEEPSNGLIFDA